MERKIRVLIADDFVYLREDLTELINKQEDMEVVGTAASGCEIVELAEKTDHDIILMDIEMEQTNAGILAAEAIRDDNPDSMIIFLTAHETKEMILTAMGAGVVDYVVKGLDDEVLLTHIRSAYEGNPIMQSRVRDTVMQEYERLQKSERSLLFFIHCISNLTGAERELVKLLLQGCKVSEIADIRKVENSTVKTQIKSLLRKFGCARSKEVVSLIEELKIGHLF